MILDKICAHKKEEIRHQMSARPLADVMEAAQSAKPPRDFRSALRAPGIALIAEIKRASPSKGVMLENVDPVELAGLYESSGAAALSILTDEEFFKGSLNDLAVVRPSVKIPCLRKDFVLDEYQIYQARAANADAILLIVRILTDSQITDFLALARTLGMAALVETHNAAEIERALKTGAHIIGINNRDLDTFEVSLDTTFELKKRVPGGHVLVSESGIHTRDDVRRLEDGGIDAILVGEALVTSNNIQAKIYELTGRDEAY